MRAGIDSTTLALQTSGAFDAHWLIQCANGSGTLIDVSDRMGGVSGSLPSPDAPIGTLHVEFLRDLNDDPATSLAPLIASDLNVLDDGTTFSALLQVGRVVVASVALTERGADRPASGFYEVFRGRVRAVSWGGWYGGAAIDCNDQAGAIQKTKSEAEYTYAAGTAIETAAQSALTNNGFSGITLSVPVASGAVLPGDYKPGLQKSTWEQVQALTQAVGFVCWYRYDASSDAQLTFFEPDRDKTVSDFTFSHIYEVNRFDVDEEEIGNVLYDQYTDSDGARQLTDSVEDATSIAKYGDIRRSFWISEEEGSPVGDNATAVAMLTAILPDLADPDAIAEYKVPLFVFGEVSVDLYTFPADDRHYDEDQKLAPFAIRFEHMQGQLPVTMVAVRGKPSGGSGAWKARRVIPSAVSEPVSVYSLNGFREVESSGPTKRKWAWDSRGAKVTSVWAADDTFTVPFSTADAWATVAAAVTKIPDDQDYYEVDVPYPDEKRLVQIEPRLSDLSVYDRADTVHQITIDPVPSTLDVVLSAAIVSNLVDLTLKLTAGSGSLPYPATALVYEGTSSGTLLASFTYTADGSKTKSDDADMGGRALPATGKKVWTVVVTDRVGNVYEELAEINAPRLPYFDGVRSVLSSDLISVDIYGTVTDPAGLGGTLEYWLPADEATATDPSGTATGSVVITAASMPYAMGPTGISAFNDVVTVGNAFSLVLQFTASDGRTTGKQAFPLAGSMQFLVDELGQLRAESVYSQLVLSSDLRTWSYVADYATLSALTPATFGNTQAYTYNATTHVGVRYVWNAGTSAWDADTTTPVVASFPIFEAGIVKAEVLAADAAILTLVGANRVVAANVNIGALDLIADDAGAIVNGSFVNAAGTAGLDLDATGTGRVFWLGGTAGSEKLKALADGTLILADYAESTDLAGLSAIIRATSAPSTRSDGTALVSGDQWIDTDDGNAPYSWSGSAWVRAYTNIDGGNVVTGTIAANRLQIGSGTTFDAGYNPTAKVTSFAQTSAPTAVATGDLWIDTDDSNKLYRWSGSAWVAYRDGTIPSITGLSAILYATTAPSTRSGGSALVQGDQWIDTDDGNRPYIWSGSAWTEAYTSIDGGSITTGALQSTIYTAGSAGWNIDTDGSAEFNNVTIRGTLDGVGGTFDTLTVDGWLRSSNYSAGADGFTINADGSAEFNDVSVRGRLEQVDMYVGATLQGTIKPGSFTIFGVPTGTVNVDGVRWSNGDDSAEIGLYDDGTVRLKGSLSVSDTISALSDIGTYGGSALGVTSNRLTFEVVASDPASGDTVLTIRTNKAGTLSVDTVTVGATDSGGTGFRVLRVPN